MERLLIILSLWAIVQAQVNLELMPSEEKLLEMLQTIYSAPIDVGTVEQSESIGPQPSIQTTSGLVYGTITEYGSTFLGIPFAEQPVGDLRFQAPVPFDHPEAIHNKTAQDVLMCYQIGFFLNRNESCLILDVYVPTDVDIWSPETTAKFPVMVSIHGGGFILGSGTWPVFDGKYLSDITRSLVVTINYRLGPFGFALFDDGENVIEGNMGIKDQQLAMKWVKDNIANFGGDPDKITIFGESAGGQSVMLHLLSDVSDPLFNHGIMQSNTWPNKFSTRERALNDTKFAIESLRCGAVDTQIERDCCKITQSDYDCLMNADPQLLVNAMMKLMARNFAQLDLFRASEPFMPFIDGDEFKKQPIDLFREGKWQTSKPILTGTNEEELIILKFVFDPVIRNETIYRRLNDAIYNETGPDIGKQISDKYIDTYNPNSTEWSWLFSQQMTDIFFGCSMRALARFAYATSKDSVFWYHFDHYLDGPDCQKRFGPLCGHSSHAFDLHFVYRTINDTGLSVDPEDIPVMNAFSTYWGGMAWDGDPNTGIAWLNLGDFPWWPKYEPTARSGFPGPWINMRINPDPHVETDYMQDMCDFLDTMGVYMDPIQDFTTTTMGTTETTEVLGKSSTKATESTTSGTAHVTSVHILTAITTAIHLILTHH